MSGYLDVLRILCDIADPQQMRIFLDEVLTPAEQRDLGLRWGLMKRLNQGMSQRQIAAELGISLCKITRGAKILRQSQSVSKRYLDSGEENGSQNSAG